MPMIAKSLFAAGVASIIVFSSPAAESTAPAAAANVADLARKLSSPLPPVRITAAESLGKIGEPATAAVPALIRALNDPEAVVRNHAAWALGKIKNPNEQIIPALFAKIDAAEEEWTVRHNATLSLSWIGQPAVPLLRKGLSAPVAWTRACSADGLIRIGPGGDDQTSIVTVINGLLIEKDASLRSFAARLVLTMGSPAAATTPGLTKLLDDPDASVRSTALQALHKIGPAASQAAPRILQALKSDGDQTVRAVAAVALGDLGRSLPETIPTLTATLADKKDRVSGSAIQALAKIGEPAVPALLESLKSDNAAKKNVIDTFSRIGEQAGAKAALVSETLIPLLKNDKEYEVRFRAASALGYLNVRSQKVLTALIEALRDENEIVRVNASDALKKLGQPTPESASGPTPPKSSGRS